MQIGIDLGATKIESVLLKENGLELHRDRIQSPKNYEKKNISREKLLSMMAGGEELNKLEVELQEMNRKN